MNDFWISYRETSEKYFLQRHYEYRFQVLVMVDGKTVYQIGERRYDLKRGDVVLLNTLEDHTLKVKSYPYCRYIFQVSPSYMHGKIQSPEILSLFVCSPENRHPVVHVKEKNFDRLCQICSEMLDESEQRASHCDRMIMADLSRFFVTILRELESQNKAVPAADAGTVLSYKVLNFLDHHYTEDITVGQVADHFFLSRHYISHVFKKTTGSGIMEYVISRRINHAQTLLSESDMPIGKVAQECGYTDFTWFSRQFRNIVGQTPSHFRAGIHRS
ncbi:MAG: AraC family transcriptional regulator [Lachnospiraceae bacterium]|nr:AraC family transcriptional regulator [Lachnospiraceae bacterium]